MSFCIFYMLCLFIWLCFFPYFVCFLRMVFKIKKVPVQTVLKRFEPELFCYLLLFMEGCFVTKVDR